MGSVNVLLNLKHVGESKMVLVNSTSTFDELKSQVYSKWSDLDDVNYAFRYSIGGVSNCSIDNDLDMCNLILLCELTSSKVVGVDISILAAKQTPANVDQGLRHASIHNTANENCSMHSSDRQSDNVMNNGEGLNWDGDDFDGTDESDQDRDVLVNINRGGRFKCGEDYIRCGEPVASSGSSDEDHVKGNRGQNLKGNGGMKSDYAAKSNRIPSRSVNNKVQSSNEVDNDGVGSMPSYDVCPNIKKKPLLSDTWIHILDRGVGTVFDLGAVEFRSELIKYSQQMGFRFKYTKNNKRYIYARCVEWEDCACLWNIKAKLHLVTKAFVVTKANLHHTCVGKFVGSKNRRMGAKITGNLIVQEVKANPHTCGKEIMDSLRIGYGMHVPYWKARRSHEAALNQLFGSYEESYDELRWYCDAVRRTNTGSVVSLESERKTNRFLRVFIAFKACLDGFKECRPMLFIDGTFMTGRAKGTLLAATAKDGNNGLFPVAIAIVSAENKDNWIWFLEKIRDVALHPLQICYISDRNTGLMAAFPLVFKSPVHFFCLYHLQTNLKGSFSKGWSNVQRENLCSLFKDIAYAPNVRLFKEKLAIFKEFGGKDAEAWIEQLPKEKWAVAYSMHIKRYGEMTSNAAEQFNAWIKEARSLPITHMIDHIRAGISNWIVERREESSKWTGALCPRKENTWNIHIDISRSWIVRNCPSGKFEVLAHPSVVVDLRGKTCSCYQWQVRGFPCAHAAVVISRKCPTIYSIVEDCFLTTKYRACYSYDIHAVPESERYEFQTEDDSQSKILPPLLNWRPGRPSKKRKPSFGEYHKKKFMYICRRCGNVANHDRTTCLLDPGEDLGS